MRKYIFWILTGTRVIEHARWSAKYIREYNLFLKSRENQYNMTVLTVNPLGL